MRTVYGTPENGAIFYSSSGEKLITDTLDQEDGYVDY